MAKLPALTDAQVKEAHNTDPVVGHFKLAGRLQALEGFEGVLASPTSYPDDPTADVGIAVDDYTFGIPRVAARLGGVDYSVAGDDVDLLTATDVCDVDGAEITALAANGKELLAHFLVAPVDGALTHVVVVGATADTGSGEVLTAQELSSALQKLYGTTWSGRALVWSVLAIKRAADAITAAGLPALTATQALKAGALLTYNRVIERA